MILYLLQHFQTFVYQQIYAIPWQVTCVVILTGLAFHNGWDNHHCTHCKKYISRVDSTSLTSSPDFNLPPAFGHLKITLSYSITQLWMC